MTGTIKTDLEAKTLILCNALHKAYGRQQHAGRPGTAAPLSDAEWVKVVEEYEAAIGVAPKLSEATPEELDVIEAAQDWAFAQEGSKYGPMQHDVRRSERALQDAVANLTAQNDGKWRRP